MVGGFEKFTDSDLIIFVTDSRCIVIGDDIEVGHSVDVSSVDAIVELNGESTRKCRNFKGVLMLQDVNLFSLLRS